VYNGAFGGGENVLFGEILYRLSLENIIMTFDDLNGRIAKLKTEDIIIIIKVVLSIIQKISSGEGKPGVTVPYP